MAYPALSVNSFKCLLSRYCTIGALLLLTIDPSAAATFTVDNNNDSGAGSFRQAVLDANASAGADSIVFGGVTGTINIDTPVTVSDDLTITGSGVDVLTLNSRVTDNFDALFLESGGSGSRHLVISDLTLQQDSTSTKRLIRGSGQAMITVRNARLLGNGNAIANSSGGAIAAIDTDVLILNTEINNFNTEFRGGAVFMHSLGSGETADLVVEDSSFSNNVTSGTSSTFIRHGGAIAAVAENSVSATITVRNTLFTGNSTSTDAVGGAIYGEDTVTIDDGIFRQNTSSRSGGAIYYNAFDGSTLTIRNSLFSNNVAGIGGGAVFSLDDDVRVENSTFDNNSVTRNGGAISAEANISIDHGYFQQNSARLSGGAINLEARGNQATLSIKNSAFTANESMFSGGAVFVMREDLEIENSTFDHNTTRFGGGAVAHEITGTVNIVNSTFSANAATERGGAISFGSTAPGATRSNMLNVTMVGNTADRGGAISGFQTDNLITIVNSVVAGNTAVTSGSEIDGRVNVDFSLIGNDPGDADPAALTELTPGNSIFDMDPMLEALADNGGQKAGRDAAMPIRTHALMPGSAVIGAGDASATNANIPLPATDQRGTGFARVKDGGIEMGAIEYDTPAAVATGEGGGSGAISLLMLLVLLAVVAGRLMIKGNGGNIY